MLSMDICKHASFCGGCTYQGVEYSKQLSEKEAWLDELIRSKRLKIKNREAIEPSPKIYFYRNKMEYTFAREGREGELGLGLHRKGNFLAITTVDECQIVPEDFNRILRACLDFVKEKAYTSYNKKSHKGLMRNLVVRFGERTGEPLINIVTQSQEASGCHFDRQAFVNRLISLELDNKIVGILHTENDQFSDTVHARQAKPIYGRAYYLEKIMGLDFQVGPFTFFQTNVSAAERLYKDAISLISDLRDKRVFDLFCGTGTIAQSLAKNCKSVLGIDIVKDSIEVAKANAVANGIDNCKFFCGDVFEILDKIQDQPDLIVVDPPRAGIQAKALDKIIGYGVSEIVYISCNPKSLVSNLYYLEYYGYSIEFLKAYDNFPWTGHVECLALLTKKNT